MQGVWTELSAKEKSKLMVALIGYIIPRPSSDFTDDEHEELLNSLRDANQEHTHKGMDQTNEGKELVGGIC